MYHLALSVIVPCLNEEENILTLYEELSRVCQSVVADKFEILMVDDGSTDATWPRILQLARNDPKVVGITLMRHFGQQSALAAGLQLCRGNRILIIDADFQDPPELLSSMMHLMDKESADIVYGRRTKLLGETLFKRFAAVIFYKLAANLADENIPADTGEFRLVRREVVDVINRTSDYHFFLRGMLSWIGGKQVSFEYERPKRRVGKTKYSKASMVRYGIEAIFGFSGRPLHFTSLLCIAVGVLCFATGFVLLIYTIIVLLSDDVLSDLGVATLLFTMSGLHFLTLGLVGEYSSRIYMEAKRRAPFVIKDVVRFEAKHQSPRID